MFLPDDGRGWVGSATAAARALLRERRFDVVITSGPPHSAHFAGMLATRGGDAKFWIDMRDPWSHTHGMSAPDDWFVPAERFLVRRMEAVLFPRTARVIANTQEFASALRVARPDLDVVYLPNGIDLEQIPRRDARAVVKGSIAYVGTLYAGRNLSSVCGAMRQLLIDHPETASTLKLNIAGPMPPLHQRQMEEDIAAAGLESVVHVHGRLSRVEALELLSRSHLALVLAQHQPLQVPAKLYECVGLGIPTLVIAETTSAAASEARRIGALTFDERDVESIRDVLEDVLACRIPPAMPIPAAISYEDLAIEMDHLLRGPAGRERSFTIDTRDAPAIRN